MHGPDVGSRISPRRCRIELARLEAFGALGPGCPPRRTPLGQRASRPRSTRRHSGGCASGAEDRTAQLSPPVDGRRGRALQPRPRAACGRGSSCCRCRAARSPASLRLASTPSRCPPAPGAALSRINGRYPAVDCRTPPRRRPCGASRRRALFFISLCERIGLARDRAAVSMHWSLE